MQSWGLGGQKTVCAVQVKELNGTWVEVAEVDPRECMTFYGRVVDWRFFHVSAWFCGCRMDSPACAISHICHYWCDHLHGLCIMENARETILKHVGCRSFWTYPDPFHDFCHGPYH